MLINLVWWTTRKSIDRNETPPLSPQSPFSCSCVIHQPSPGTTKDCLCTNLSPPKATRNTIKVTLFICLQRKFRVMVKNRLNRFNWLCWFKWNVDVMPDCCKKIMVPFILFNTGSFLLCSTAKMNMIMLSLKECRYMLRSSSGFVKYIWVIFH